MNIGWTERQNYWHIVAQASS